MTPGLLPAHAKPQTLAEVHPGGLCLTMQGLLILNAGQGLENTMLQVAAAGGVAGIGEDHHRAEGACPDDQASLAPVESTRPLIFQQPPDFSFRIAPSQLSPTVPAQKPSRKVNASAGSSA